MTTTEKLRDLIEDQLGINPESITPNSTLAQDLGADSLDIVELQMAVDEEWGLDCQYTEKPWNDNATITVDSIVKYIDDRYDPTPYCSCCRARKQEDCTCPKDNPDELRGDYLRDRAKDERAENAANSKP